MFQYVLEKYIEKNTDVKTFNFNRTGLTEAGGEPSDPDWFFSDADVDINVNYDEFDNTLFL